MGTLRALVEAATSNRNVQAFLQVIRAAEGTSGRDGYRTIFGGSMFEDYSDHPRQKIPFRNTYSTAAGAYQFLASTWDECKKTLELPDFSPTSQDRAAIYLIYRRGALEDVYAGRIAVAIDGCNKEWASLPGSPYGQPVKPLSFCLMVYTDNGGVLRNVDRPGGTPTEVPEQPAVAIPPIQKESPRMGTLLATLLPSVLQLFSGRAQAAIAKATDSPAAAEKFTNEFFAKLGAATGIPVTDEASAIKAVAAAPDLPPAKLKALEDSAVAFALVEVGGGIGGARDANFKYIESLEDDEPWRIALKFLFNPLNWVTGAFLWFVQQFIPSLAARVADLSGEAVLGLILLVLAVIAVIGAFYYGTYMQKKEDA